MIDEAQRGSQPPWRSLAKSVLATVARRPAFDPLLTGRGAGHLDRVRNSAGFLARYAPHYRIFGVHGATRLLAPGLRRDAQAGRSPHYDLSLMDEVPHGTVLERVTGVCLRGYTTSQLLRDIDAVSMAHSLEVRVPYLDPVVADAALSLPDEAKMTGPPVPGNSAVRSYREAGTKRVLLDIARPLLPEGYDTTPKRGFGMPFGAWLRGPLRDVLSDALADETTRARGWLDAEAVAGVREGFLGGTVEWFQPWLLMMLELWAREVLDATPADLAARAREHGVGEAVGAR
jgi:asparagine synthase (glutamine-hydrolysing)